MDTTSKNPVNGSGVAVALGSSFFGFYTHAAFMASLNDAGIFPAQVAGTSAGAIVALLCGCGIRGRALVEFVMGRGMRTCFWDWLAPLRMPGVATSMYSSGILSGSRALEFFHSQLGSPNLEDMHAPKVQFAVTNLTKRKAEVIGEGPAVEFAMASSAVPGLFCNQVINGERWCDGGVAMDVPFSHWLDDPTVHTIVLHRIQHIRGTEMLPKWPTLSSGIAISHSVITDTIYDLRLAEAKRSGKRIIEILTHTAHPKLFPTKREGLIAAGYEAGERAARLLAESTSPH